MGAGQYSVSGIALRHGNAILRNNIVWSVENGAGIRLYQTFQNPRAARIVIEKNTISGGAGVAAILVNSGTPDGTVSPIKPIVQLTRTYTNDGSEGSTAAASNLFIGPCTGDADSGAGPGSGFRVKKYRNVGADDMKIRKSLEEHWRLKAERSKSK